MPDDDPDYIADSCRDYYVFGQFIGKKLVDVTQNEPGERPQFVMLMFEDGSAIKIPSRNGFQLINVEGPD